ncbi:addiction module antitoxin RelB [Bordetella genomosp. 1]|uniref:Addiction module antitoxin RelB n=1 Tax=Bordetella genomosp. 1 TaxID=1395607 RepID=A0A261RVW7_9BORD|nr:addiction module antitoxin RelB [Bordetella genomosp. 1]
MLEIIQSDDFRAWHDRLSDKIAWARIHARIRLASCGSLGNWRPVAGRVSEMRIDVGPGYRVYFIRHHAAIVLLCGGNKRTQDMDIRKASVLARMWRF